MPQSPVIARGIGYLSPRVLSWATATCTTTSTTLVTPSSISRVLVCRLYLCNVSTTNAAEVSLRWSVTTTPRYFKTYLPAYGGQLSMDFAQGELLGPVGEALQIYLDTTDSPTVEATIGYHAVT